MKFYSAKANPHFIGRAAYWQRLTDIDASKEAAIIVIYGRRRVGKTELIEQFFLGRPLSGSRG